MKKVNLSTYPKSFYKPQKIGDSISSLFFHRPVTYMDGGGPSWFSSDSERGIAASYFDPSIKSNMKNKCMSTYVLLYKNMN